MSAAFLDFARAVATDDVGHIARTIGANPSLATAAADVGATRQVHAPRPAATIESLLSAGADPNAP